MFFQPGDGSPGSAIPLNALIVPRPIGWISTRDLEGTANLAPYSFFNAVAAPSDVDEFAHTGLTKAPSRLVTSPRVAESPVQLECRTTQSLELPSTDPASPNTAVFGQVVGVHIDDTCIRDSHLELTRLHPIGRLGYQDYVDIDNSFSMPRPTWTK